MSIKRIVFCWRICLIFCCLLLIPLLCGCSGLLRLEPNQQYFSNYQYNSFSDRTTLNLSPRNVDGFIVGAEYVSSTHIGIAIANRQGTRADFDEVQWKFFSMDNGRKSEMDKATKTNILSNIRDRHYINVKAEGAGQVAVESLAETMGGASDDSISGEFSDRDNEYTIHYKGEFTKSGSSDNPNTWKLTWSNEELGYESTFVFKQFDTEEGEEYSMSTLEAGHGELNGWDVDVSPDGRFVKFANVIFDIKLKKMHKLYSQGCEAASTFSPDWSELIVIHDSCDGAFKADRLDFRISDISD